jgi:hypothetical protein
VPPEVDQSEKVRFDDFLAWLWKSIKSIPNVPILRFSGLSAEVEKISPEHFDLMSFWPWLQKSTESIPEICEILEIPFLESTDPPGF